MTAQVTPFLMFQGGTAEEAMEFYVSLIDGSRIENITRYGPEGPGPEGSVMHASFILGGQRFICIDSPVKHNFSFTPSSSLFVACKDDEEIDSLFARLSDGGQILMPLSAYPFSPRYAWLNDKYGVSWQLSVAAI